MVRGRAAFAGASTDTAPPEPSGGMLLARPALRMPPRHRWEERAHARWRPTPQTMGRARGGGYSTQTLARSRTVADLTTFNFDAVFGSRRSSSGPDPERDRIGFACDDPVELRRLCELAKDGDFAAPLVALADLVRAGSTQQHVLIEAFSFGVRDVIARDWSDPIDELEYEFGWRPRWGADPHISGIFHSELRKGVADLPGVEFPDFADLDSWLQGWAIDAAAGALAFYIDLCGEAE